MGRVEVTGDPTAALPEFLRDEHGRLAEVYAPPGTFLVAYRDGVPVGCVGVLVRTGCAEIRRLYAPPVPTAWSTSGGRWDRNDP